MELVGPKNRNLAGMVICIFYALGYILLAAIAYAVSGNWRQLEIILAALTVPFFSYYWLLPESIRWLMQQGRYDKAEEILQKASKMNKHPLPDNALEDERRAQEKLEEEMKNDPTLVKENYTMIDLFKTKNLRWRTINISFNWFANSFVYYGLSVNATSLSDNPYASFFLSGAVEIPAYLLTWYLLDKVGRRFLICVFMVIGGISLIMTIPVNNTSLDGLVAFLALFGKFCISGSYAIVYILAAEIYPTPIRSAGVGFANFWGRIGAILAPLVVLLGDYVWEPLPSLIYGGLALAAGILVFLLPETKGVHLPETMAEGEHFGTKIMNSSAQINGKYITTVDIGLQADISDDSMGDNDNH